MLIAAAVVTVGLVYGIVTAQIWGYRLGGVVVVPLFAVYALRSFESVAMFLASVVVAYAILAAVKRYTLLYGRPLFLVAVAAGAVVPVAAFELSLVGGGFAPALSAVEFVGSVLPGIAAYNFHRLDAERRVEDALVALATLLFLVVFGVGLTFVVGTLGGVPTVPALLLGPQSDVARTLGVVVAADSSAVVVSRVGSVLAVVTGLVASEFARRRWGIRLVGVIALPLVALFAVRNPWTVPLYVVATAVAGVGVVALHRWTLVYGRVLLSMGVFLGLAATVAIIPFTPFSHGLLPFFVGILAGVGAYNLHAVSPAERLDAIGVSAAVGVALVAAVRLLVGPNGTGIGTSPGRTVVPGAVASPPTWLLAAALLALVWGVVSGLRLERLVRPTGTEETRSRPGELDGGGWL
jgi:hypothetical protein